MSAQKPVDVEAIKRRVEDALGANRRAKLFALDVVQSMAAELIERRARDAAVDDLIAAAKTIRRPAAELANNAACDGGYICRGAIARHASGEVGPDYVGQVETALQRIDAALAGVREGS